MERVSEDNMRLRTFNIHVHINAETMQYKTFSPIHLAHKEMIWQKDTARNTRRYVLRRCRKDERGVDSFLSHSFSFAIWKSHQIFYRQRRTKTCYFNQQFSWYYFLKFHFGKSVTFTPFQTVPDLFSTCPPMFFLLFRLVSARSLAKSAPR